MYLRMSSSPKYSTEVRDMQVKLNAIRTAVHGTWPNVSEDGLFGKETQQAVRGFQIYRNITPASGDVGDTTMKYIAEAYDQIKIARPSSSNGKTIAAGIMDAFVELVKNVDDLVKQEIAYAVKLGKCDPQAIVGHMKSSIGRLDPAMKKLKQSVRTNLDSQKFLSQQDSIPRTPSYAAKSTTELLRTKSIERSRSFYQTKTNYSRDAAARISRKYVVDIQKYNIVQKIGDTFKRYGITGEIKLPKLKSIKIKAGGIFMLYSLKDIIGDLLQFDQWGQEAWQKRLSDHCYKFLDVLILGTVAAAVAGLLVSLGSGVSIAAGTLAVIVAVLTIIIALVLDLVLKWISGDDEFSLSRTLWETAATKAVEAAYRIK